MTTLDMGGDFAGAYPRRPASLRHALANAPLFDLDRLISLARALPESSIEYNAGDAPLSCDPAQAPKNGLSAIETLQRIDVTQSWIVLKNVEQDPDFRTAMARCLASVAPVVSAATGCMHRQEAFVFVSSPGAITPFHMDPEHNILLQVRGRKTMHVYPYGDYAIVPAERHEAYHAGGHRNLEYRPEFDSVAKAYALGPGDAVYVPVKAPHRVRVDEGVSVSFSITWRSSASVAEARLHRMNARLRRAGGRPPLPGARPMRDAAAAFGERILSRF